MPSQHFSTTHTTGLSQDLRPSPRMIQSMEVLQMPLPVLQEHLDQELESNIALEIDEDQVAAGGADTDSNAEVGDQDAGDEGPEGSAEFQRLDSMEQSYTEAYDNSMGSRSLAGSGSNERRHEMMANLRAPGDSLQDEVLHQWSFADVDPDVSRAGRCIIGDLSGAGLLEVSLEAVRAQSSDAAGLGHDAFETALSTLQRLVEPCGIGARSLQECLLLQVAWHAQDTPELAEAWGSVGLLIADHLNDLVENRLPEISRATGLKMDALKEAKQLMHRLSLAPGRDLSPDYVPPVIPDVLVEFDEVSDAYVATLLDGPIPPLRVSPQYEQMAKDKSLDPEARTFLNRNVQNAHWLIDAMQQRGATLLKVVNVVLDKQRAYFDEGPGALKPLPMTKVADMIGVHLGTVSRAVADKWMQTPRGMVELRRLFSGGMATDSGETMSGEAIREVLRELVEQEDKTQPMSDELLASALAKRGIQIARRTVLKYRQALGIPPRRLRRTY